MSKKVYHTIQEGKSSIVYTSCPSKKVLHSPKNYVNQLTGYYNSIKYAEENNMINEDSNYYNDLSTSLLAMSNGKLSYVERGNYGTIYDNDQSHLSLPSEFLDEERDLFIDKIHYQNNGLSDITDYTIIETCENIIESGKGVDSSYINEIFLISKAAFPLIFTFILQNSLPLSSIFAISRLGVKELGGLTLGSMTANITGFAAIQGLCTCLDTLCSQAYGAKNYHLVGVLLQRCAIISLLAFMPILILWWQYSESILSTMIPENDLCVLASQYLKVVVFGVPGFILFECGKRFLQCQGIFHASTVVLICCAPLNALMSYLLVWSDTIGIGYLGAPLSITLTYWLMAFGLLFYTIFTKNNLNPRKCWHGLIKPCQIFKNWSVMCSLALPSVIMVEAEFLGFELLTIFASHLGTQELAAQSIVSTVASLAYQIPFSISISTSTRVANLIGALSHKTCIITCKVSLLLSFIISFSNMIIIYVFRQKIAGWFSQEADIICLVTNVLPILALMQLFDAFNACTAGCLRGQGRQKIGGYINVFAFYFIGIPISSILTFKLGLGINGLWYGITCSLVVMSIFQGYAVFNCNWSKIMHTAKLRCSEGSDK